MNRDTQDFLAILLWLADNPDEKQRPLMGKTIRDFSDKFAEGADKFIAAFRQHLIGKGWRPEKLDGAERSFGGNVFFSLSGHGCGFFDDRDEEIAALDETVKEWAGGNRFEELDYMLDVGEDGKIDLSYKPSAIDEMRAALFAVL
ncbi:MAG: hypothetical protein BWY66_00378 [bacterium ADurb.Bin374]|nr:MAG: hypothetical protein BWY66_00378 [bacterium ADurb.Bin374]